MTVSTDIATGKVTFTTAPPSDVIITFTAKFGVVTYHTAGEAAGHGVQSREVHGEWDQR